MASTSEATLPHATPKRISADAASHSPWSTAASTSLGSISTCCTTQAESAERSVRSSPTPAKSPSTRGSTKPSETPNFALPAESKTGLTQGCSSPSKKGTRRSLVKQFAKREAEVFVMGGDSDDDSESAGDLSEDG